MVVVVGFLPFLPFLAAFRPSFFPSFLAFFLPLSFLPSFPPSFLPLSSRLLPSFLPSLLPSFLPSFRPDSLLFLYDKGKVFFDCKKAFFDWKKVFLIGIPCGTSGQPDSLSDGLYYLRIARRQGDGVLNPKAPCTVIVDTWALKGSLYRYFKA